ncbi:MAG: biotin--[Treponema sp.]|nr:biotin--[acetyl-CoA-carboxylase] ligase [Treponema sp.]
MTTREAVVRELVRCRAAGGFVSGLKIAQLCGISRQAVCKVIHQLQHDGMVIETSRRHGYRLQSTATVLSAAVIEALLDPARRVTVRVYDTIDSTNNEAKRQCAAAPDVRLLDGTVIISDCQTAGRGRMGRSFFSPARTGLYASLIVVPERTVSAPALLTALAAVAVCRAISRVYGVEPQIKWVNDIFLHGKKVCGILAEGISNFETNIIEYAVIGIGVNILPGAFSAELTAVATAIMEHVDDDSKRNELGAAIIGETYALYRGSREKIDEAMCEYRTRSCLIERNVRIVPVGLPPERSWDAQVLDITDDARLVVQTASGERVVLDSGEVSLGSQAVI